MIGIDTQQRLTAAFIKQDPTDIVLIPTVKTTTPAGTQTHEDGTPRPVQTFKLSAFTDANRPVVTLNGVERVAEYTLIGRHDATVAIGDHWTMPDGRRAEVIGTQEGFGYMVKALVEAHG